MSKTLPLILVLAGSTAAWADDKPSPPQPDDTAARICQSYGPGYELVPETGLCIKISGSIDVTVGVHGSGGEKQGK
jgi:hypothetical protein